MHSIYGEALELCDGTSIDAPIEALPDELNELLEKSADCGAAILLPDRVVTRRLRACITVNGKDRSVRGASTLPEAIIQCLDNGDKWVYIGVQTASDQIVLCPLLLKTPRGEEN